jgi:hypothetical protein
MEPNSDEEKELLRKRPLVETVIGKIRNFFGPKLSRFRSPQAAFSAIYSGVLAVNLECQIWAGILRFAFFAYFGRYFQLQSGPKAFRNDFLDALKRPARILRGFIFGRRQKRSLQSELGPSTLDFRFFQRSFFTDWEPFGKAIFLKIDKIGGQPGTLQNQGDCPSFGSNYHICWPLSAGEIAQWLRMSTRRSKRA